MPTPGPLEIAVILVIALLVFGPKRLPDLGRSAGRGIREFKAAISSVTVGEDEKPAQPLATGTTAGHPGPVTPP